MENSSNCIHIWKKPTHTQIKESSPLSSKWRLVVAQSIENLKDIISWKSDRKIWIVWPCSVDFEESILKYWEELSKIRDKHKNEIEIVMRFYTGKPRTVWGWKWVQNSKPWEEPDIWKCLIESRKMAVKIIENFWMPIADEMLHPQLIKSFDDIYSYIAIWARSSENQSHREIASGLDMPIGFKNPTSWDLSVMINSIKSWQTESFYTIWEDIYFSRGNNFSHWILRGSNFEWNIKINYDKKSLKKIFEKIKSMKIKNPWFIIDTNHDNSWKDPSRQLNIMMETIKNLQSLEKSNKGILSMFKGFMTESYLYKWRQDYDKENLIKWKSITDPCSSIEETREMAEYISYMKRKLEK